MFDRGDFHRILQSSNGNLDQWSFRSDKSADREVSTTESWRFSEEYSDAGGFGSVGEGAMMSPPGLWTKAMMNDSRSSTDRSVFTGLGEYHPPIRNVTTTVTVPSSDQVAEIVGRNGCKIKALRMQYDAYIKTPSRGSNNTFIITGLPAAVQAVKENIESAADHFAQIRASRQHSQGKKIVPGHVTLSFPVQYRMVGLVVGAKGATIKRIQQETHTYIVTPSRDSLLSCFLITGMPENVEIAREMIEAHIHHRTGHSRMKPISTRPNYPTLKNMTKTNDTESMMNENGLLKMIFQAADDWQNCLGLFTNDQKEIDCTKQRPPAFTTKTDDKFYEENVEQGNACNQISNGIRMGSPYFPGGCGFGLDSFAVRISDDQMITAVNQNLEEPTNEICNLVEEPAMEIHPLGPEKWFSHLVCHQNRPEIYSLF